jgi:hypothetical protein
MAYLLNPVSVFWIAIVLISVVPTTTYYWHRTRKAEMDADLKMRMLEMGMSANDIERVLRAESQESTARHA